jgi:hypothetical protein
MNSKFRWMGMAAGIVLTILSAQARAADGIGVGQVMNGVGGGKIEVRGIKECRATPADEAESALDLAFARRADMTCRNRDNITSALKVVQMSFTAVGIAAMCTVEGAPIGIAVGTLGLGAQLVEFVVSQLPCTDPENDEKTKRLAKRIVCEELVKKGFECNPDRL